MFSRSKDKKKVDLKPQVDKPKRTFQMCAEEFTKLCNKAGELSYQINVLKKDLEMVTNTMRDLNIEASQLKQAEDEANAKAAAAAAPIPRPKEEVKL